VLRIWRNRRELYQQKTNWYSSKWIKKYRTLKKCQSKLINKDIQKMNFWIRLLRIKNPIPRFSKRNFHDDDDDIFRIRKSFQKYYFRIGSFKSFDWQNSGFREIWNRKQKPYLSKMTFPKLYRIPWFCKTVNHQNILLWV
jgi:hypothetical protein